ncbi:MAG: NUDIX domain-containing protein [Bacilli bacterium]|nr:NUDIX domain-containing protein [Bacilli bacterium]
MIEEKIENYDIDTFICYRNDHRVCAATLKEAMKIDKMRYYGRVWYSNSEGGGNYIDGIDPLLKSAENVVLVLAKGFTDHFIKDGEVNDNDNKIDVTATIKELQKIEELREENNIKIYAVNVDGYFFDEEAMDVLIRAIMHSPNVKSSEEEIRKAWAFQGRNPLKQEYTVSDKKMLMFMEEEGLASALTLKYIKPKEEITFLDQNDYDKAFYQLAKEKNNLTNIAYFGYAGAVFLRELFGSTFGYRDRQNEEYKDIRIRILLRDPIIEAEEERMQEVKKGRRPRRKSADILKTYQEIREKSGTIRLDCRFYSHTPYLKGAIFCDKNWEPRVGLINFESAYGKDYIKKGGSPFKGIDSDMIYFNGDLEYNTSTIKALKTLMTQFEFDWKMGKALIDEDEVCSPLSLELEDPYYDRVDREALGLGDRPVRHCVRGIIVNENGEIALHHCHRDDKYGDFEYYELPGGGYADSEGREDELPFDGLKRECEEECGFKIKRLAYLGEVKDEYNLADRFNYHYVFLCKLIGETKKHFESEGDNYILDTDFYPFHTAIKMLKKQHQDGFAGLVRQRELPFLELAEEVYENFFEEEEN